MRFEIRVKNIDFSGELLYVRDEHSLLYKPHNPNIGVGILCGAYTELGTICETCEVVELSGFNHRSSWIPMRYKIPKSLKGSLIACFDKPPIKGAGVEYDRSWQTYYNEQEDCLCIGDFHSHTGDDCIEFANGIIAVLRNNQLIAVWAKIKEVSTAV